MKRQLYRSHRMTGYEIARATAPDGTKLVILETGPHELKASPAHLLRPVSDDEATFEATVALMAAIERARFLGVDMDALRVAFDATVNGQ